MQSQSKESETTPQQAAVNPNKALWEKGDFTEIAAFMRQSGEAIAKSLGIAPPLRVAPGLRRWHHRSSHCKVGG